MGELKLNIGFVNIELEEFQKYFLGSRRFLDPATKLNLQTEQKIWLQYVTKRIIRLLGLKTY